MHYQKTCLSFALFLALAATGALAADAERDQHHPGTTPPAATGAVGKSAMPMGSMPGNAGNMPMTGMMQMMMGQNGMAGHVEGRIAFLKTELKINDAQQPLWNAVADAIRQTASVNNPRAARTVLSGKLVCAFIFTPSRTDLVAVLPRES